MASIQLYFKPRPISRKYGHSKYLPFKWPFDSKYGPFFADYGIIPSDATEVYTIQSSALVTSLSTFYNELIPGLDAKVPNPNKFHRSEWSGLLQLAVAKADSSFCFQLECEDHIVRLAKGSRAPPPPPTDMRIIDLSPEWYNIVYSTHIRGDVELRDKSRDTELELFVWVYMFYVADDRTEIWRGFRQEMYQLTKFFFPARLPFSYAESPVAAEPPANENEPPLLSLPSSHGLSSMDSTSFSHAGDEVDLSALNRPSRRRNFVVADSVDV
ncbi:hypothetical protein EV421DRAFT_1946981 [Armillaria borealis]|uniref:Uncharacterized protein n=1 Tax=Armillaria borealis TaxID=47425 RepID=A0AA39MRH5_9AGAR|nr:hypothetical protein EV421DRAFT_1946981 [Armillaria borealis]